MADKPLSAAAVAVFEEAFGATWRKGPIPTALDVLSHDLRLAGAWHAPRLPEPALIGSTEVPLAWTRKLDPDELARGWVIGFDKHAAYLGVLGSLELGIGDPWHDVWKPGEPWLAAGRKIEPGYWRVRCSYPPPDPRFPDPLGRDRARRRREASFWITTPTLDLAIEAGLEVEVCESWTWPTHHRLLRRFGDRCHTARKSLIQADTAFDETAPLDGVLDQRVAAREALRGLKSLYGATLGGFFGRVADRKLSPRPPWYRPDWRHHIIAKARANLWRNLASWRAYGVHPIGIWSDAFYLAVETQYGAYFAPDCIPIGASLGSYTMGALKPLDQVVHRGRLSWPRLFRG